MATIRKRSRKWQVLVRRKGLSISRSFFVLKDAQAWARHMEVQADRGSLPPDSKVLDRLSLGELVVRYRDTVTPTKRTAATERIVLNAFLRRSICSKRLTELRTEHFATYRDQRLRDIKPSSLSRELTPIRHLFEVARKEWGLPLPTNPLSGLDIQNANSHRERRLRPGELERLLSAADRSRTPLIKELVVFALLTGMRRGEILALEWGHIDHSTQSLFIPVTKTGHARTIPLLREALGVLKEAPKTHDRVFPITANSVRLSWERITRRANIEDLHFHDLRHEAISRFFEMGLSVPEVALISGHREPRMLFRYTHPLRALIISKLADAKTMPLITCRG